ncbi:secreted protein [Melampsora americana]|nr:secreted protein [Melampsora americana]
MKFPTSISFVLLAILVTAYSENVHGADDRMTHVVRDLTDQEHSTSSNRRNLRSIHYGRSQSLHPRTLGIIGGGESSGFGEGGFNLKSMFDGFMKMFTGGAGGAGGAPPAPGGAGGAGAGAGGADTPPPAGGNTPPPAGGDTPPPAGGDTPPPAGGDTPPPAGGDTPPPAGGGPDAAPDGGAGGGDDSAS